MGLFNCLFLWLISISICYYFCKFQSNKYNIQFLFHCFCNSPYTIRANQFDECILESKVKRAELLRNLNHCVRYINTEDYEGGFDQSDIEQMIANMESNYENWATQFSSLVVDEADPLSLSRLRKCLHQMRPEVAVSLAKTVFRVDEREILEKVNIPCTILHTKTDIAAPASVAIFMQKQIKGSCTVRVINTNGHFPHLTAHLQLLQVLGEILGF